MSSVKPEEQSVAVAEVAGQNTKTPPPVTRESHDYAVVTDRPGPGNIFSVHKDIVRRHSPMIAAWIDNHPEFDYFHVNYTNELAVGMMILFMYNSGNLPTLDEVTKAWPECTPKTGLRQKPLPQGPKFDLLQFTTYVQAYDLAGRYVVPQFQNMMGAAAYRFAYEKLIMGSEVGQQALSTVLMHTHPDDQGLRRSVVALCACMKPLLDQSDNGKAAMAVIERYAPWSWQTCLRTAQLTKDSYIQNHSDNVLPNKSRSRLPKALKPKALESKVSKRSQSTKREQPVHVVKEVIDLAKKATALVQEQDDNNTGQQASAQPNQPGSSTC